MINWNELIAKAKENKFMLLAILMGLLIVGNIAHDTYKHNSFEVVKTDTIKEMKPEVKEAFCESKEYVLKTSDLLDVNNLAVLDLSTFEQFKVKRIDSNRVGYYYRRSGAVKEFYTVFRNEPLIEDENTSK